jgi:hypothetical protein
VRKLIDILTGICYPRPWSPFLRHRTKDYLISDMLLQSMALKTCTTSSLRWRPTNLTLYRLTRKEKRMLNLENIGQRWCHKEFWLEKELWSQSSCTKRITVSVNLPHPIEHSAVTLATHREVLIETRDLNPYLLSQLPKSITPWRSNLSLSLLLTAPLSI